jgi:hypothetical protein
MTLPTGAISFSDINTEMRLQATAPLTMNADLLRRIASAGGTGVQTTSGTVISLSQLQGHAYGIYQNTSGQSVYNINVATVFTGTGNYAAGKTYGAITNAGTIGSANTSSYGLTATFIEGDILSIQNTGYIVGHGGTGGAAGSGGGGGGGYPGGPAFYTKGGTSAFIQMQNTGTIGGGGGGGGGGAYAQDTQNQRVPLQGGGGGGGAGYAGGTGGPGYGTGGQGTLTQGGYGGGGGGQAAQTGSPGGGLGQVGGSSGNNGYGSGGPGGAGGGSVAGTNWFVGGVSGTILGTTSTT